MDLDKKIQRNYTLVGAKIDKLENLLCKLANIPKITKSSEFKLSPAQKRESDSGIFKSPKAIKIDDSSPTLKPKHKTDEQKSQLTQIYEYKKFLTSDEASEVAIKTGLTKREVLTWFCQRRFADGVVVGRKTKTNPVPKPEPKEEQQDSLEKKREILEKLYSTKNWVSKKEYHELGAKLDLTPEYVKNYFINRRKLLGEKSQNICRSSVANKASPEQQAQLQRHFDANPRMCAKDCQLLGSALNLPGKYVANWFQNKRQRVGITNKKEVFTTEQKKMLSDAFQKNEDPKHHVHELELLTGLRPNQIINWFSRQRRVKYGTTKVERIEKINESRRKIEDVGEGKMERDDSSTSSGFQEQEDFSSLLDIVS